jgi:2,3-bisphosphoglycerate-independent phosphoglycerate mutase
MGNSEVGHLNIGAGRVVYQEFTRVSKAIETGTFFTNDALVNAVETVAKQDKAVHILGLLSDGGVHSHQEHIEAMVKLAVDKGVNKVYVHAFTDGRDTPPQSAKQYVSELEAAFKAIGGGRIASVIGRFYAMDRDKRWERVEQAYNLIAHGQSEFQVDDAITAIEQSYARGENDEFVKSTVIGNAVKVEEGDSIVFMNFRSDRARELTQCFIDDDFDGFDRAERLHLSSYVTLTEYKKEFDVDVAFPPEKLNNILGEYLSSSGLTQLRIAETEKYAHVTFFFNGGSETPFEGEDRILIPSPKVKTYDEQPAMNAPEVADQLVKAIHSNKYDVIICNFANADMVGHTGSYDAAVKAIEALDNCLGKVWSALKEAGGEMIVTADHGNAEKMKNETTGQAHTAHTNNLVPFIYAGRDATCSEEGTLSDIAPTMLSLMGLAIPAEMSTHRLIKLN